KLKMMLADRLFFTAMVVLPLFITVAAGYALRYEKLNTIPIAVVDEDNTAYSSVLLERLEKKEGFRIMEVGRDDAVALLEGNKVEQVFIIKSGFEEKIKSGEKKELIDVVTSPSSYSASLTSEVIAGEVMRLITGEIAADWVQDEYKKLGKAADGSLREEVAAYNDSLWEPKPLMTIIYKEIQGGGGIGNVERVSLPAATATSTGVIVAFMMFYILFSSGWLVEERTNGTLKRLASGPGALLVSYMGSILALLIAGFIQILLFSFIDKLVFDVELFPGVLAYPLFFMYLLAVISISLFLSAVLKTQAQLQAGAPVLALLTGFAGGSFWNFVEMPDRIKLLSMFTPQGWVLQGIKGLIAEPAGFDAIRFPMMVLFVISLILMPLSYIIINKNIKTN
ncbi:MAG: ABC transporter permease, partial [Desulfitobacterium hafniense]|nr:ABC transporter permease [Desulfitobacterium hafniense]